MFFRKVLDAAFILSGAKLYLDWLLITNPASKNPVIKFFWGWAELSYTAWTPTNRLQLAWVAGWLHFCFASMEIIGSGRVSITNILVNIYPVFVQIYIGYRCHKVIKRKSKRYDKLPLASYRR